MKDRTLTWLANLLSLGVLVGVLGAVLFLMGLFTHDGRTLSYALGVIVAGVGTCAGTFLTVVVLSVRDGLRERREIGGRP